MAVDWWDCFIWGQPSFIKMIWVRFLSHRCHTFCLKSSLLERVMHQLVSHNLGTSSLPIFWCSKVQCYQWDEKNKKEAGFIQSCFSLWGGRQTRDSAAPVCCFANINKTNPKHLLISHMLYQQTNVFWSHVTKKSRLVSTIFAIFHLHFFANGITRPKFNILYILKFILYVLLISSFQIISFMK